MVFDAPPATAAWQHQDVRSGFEVVYFHPLDDGWRIEGCTTAIENRETWTVDYTIDVDHAWATRDARISGQSASGPRSTVLETDGHGHWLVDGHAAPHLDGCLDLDLESSAMTNALPVHRIGLSIGAEASCPAVYIRALDLAVERLEQTYVRIPDMTSRQRYEYTAPAFQFASRLVYDESGLVLEYPGIAIRVGV
jgi:uncharacterized protein